MTRKMVLRKWFNVLMCLILLLCIAEAQDKYKKGDFKGFTINEPVIQRSKENLTTKTIRGQIYFSDDNGYPMEGALFEIQGPGSCETIRSVSTDENGYFEFKDLPEGRYIYKASSLGYNAVAGVITLSQRANADSIPRIFLQPGF